MYPVINNWKKAFCKTLYVISIKCGNVIKPHWAEEQAVRRERRCNHQHFPVYDKGKL